MTPGRVPLETPLRVIAAAIAVVAMALLYSLEPDRSRTIQAATILSLVFSAGAAFVLLCRNLGSGVAAGLGIIMAIALSIGVAKIGGEASVVHWAFMLVAVTIFLLVGRVAGANDFNERFGGTDLSELLRRSRSQFEQTPGTNSWTPATDAQFSRSIESVLGGLISDFQAWTGTGAVNGRNDLPWQGFARFVRQALRERLGARHVRVYAYREADQTLEPLALGHKCDEEVPNPAGGVLGYAIQTGQVFARSKSTGRSDLEPRWCWILPLRAQGHTQMVIAIGDLEQTQLNRPSVGFAVRDLMQLCWAHVCGVNALAAARQLDAQTGLLNRAEVLDAMRHSATAARRGEPVAVLAVGLEGLRRLDDQGHYQERDQLLQQLGQALRAHLHTDDLIGRFNDDRFVVVMQRADVGLGATVAKLILDDVRDEVIGTLDPLDTLKLTVRGGLVRGEVGEDGETLLMRALAQLDKARTAGLTLATPEAVTGLTALQTQSSDAVTGASTHG